MSLGIKHLCDVDLLVFFARHPRALLASEQLAAYTGYSLQQIAESLEVLVHLGVLSRTTNSAHAARMYIFSLGGSPGSPPAVSARVRRDARGPAGDEARAAASIDRW